MSAFNLKPTGTKWKSALSKLLQASRFCWYLEGNTKPLQLVEEEFYGASDEMGYLDHVTDFISEQEKRAYLAGFLHGAQEVATEHNEVVESPTNQITAERRYLVWRE
jgi:hypothetical protein